MADRRVEKRVYQTQFVIRRLARFVREEAGRRVEVLRGLPRAE